MKFRFPHELAIMDDSQQQILQLPGGIQPHYCRLCRNLMIIDNAGDRKDEERGNCLHTWKIYTLQQVCEFGNSGCVMFSLQLKELHQAKNDRSFSISGLLREICGAAYSKRLQLFYPLVPLRVLLEELNDLSLRIKFSAGDGGRLTCNWKTKYAQVKLEQKPMILFADEGDYPTPLRLVKALRTYSRKLSKQSYREHPVAAQG
jgi:hypothetical protein